jgi:hypothetical protein
MVEVRKDLTGQRFGRLVVIRQAGDHIQPNGVYYSQWDCQCDCGNTVTVRGDDLKRNHTQSCGCLRREKMTKHGKSNHPFYGIWKDIKDRCYNPNNKRFKDYGGRGIKVCDEWREDVGEFIEWAEANGWEPGLQIDRIDNDKGYFPGNCRFIDNRGNILNRRPLFANNTSGFAGVTFDKQTGKWVARIKIRGKYIWLGRYTTKEAAAIARDRYILENNLQGEYRLQILAA